MLEKVSYIGLRLGGRPPIEKEDDGSILTIDSSPMESGLSALQKGHTDRQTLVRTTEIDRSPCPVQVRCGRNTA